jgi:hypothetical protein
LIHHSITRSLTLAAALLLATPPMPAQTQPDAPIHRIRLIMKDGTYQLVLSYKVSGNIVHYRSAERGGETEDVPLALVDLPATEKYAAGHANPQSTHAPVLSPELAAEEAARAARTPEILPDLRLPEEDSVLALDTFKTIPELVPLEQKGGDLNRETAHNTLKLAINPASLPHDILDLPNDRADVQLHTPQPVFYLRIGDDDEGDTGSGAIVVDTHGASGRPDPSGGAATSGYVLERLSVRSDARTVNSFRIAQLGVKAQLDIIEMKPEDLPGNHWTKLTPTQPLQPGEYALIEVLNDHELNLGVWDFGLHPDAKEDVEAIRPTPKRPATLERRTPQ